MANDASSRWVAAPSEALCLDYANTRFWRGTEAPTETLGGSDDLIAWCIANEALPAGRAEACRRAPADALFADALALREAIYRVFLRLAAKAAPDDADLAMLNSALGEAPPRRALAALRDGFGWEVEALAPSAGSLLTPVLWSAGDLLTGRRLGKLRHCANERCLWLFLDDSKSGNRRWCSMSACGNRAKAHRHYIKRRRSA